MDKIIDKITFEINENEIIKYTPIREFGSDGTICKREIVMTKDMFLACYHFWVEREKNNE